MPERTPAGSTQRSRRRTFGPVVLLGLATAGLAAVAGDKPAAEASGRGAVAADSGFMTYDAHLPAVTALALVVLACWGVVLVTRGRVRRAVTVLGVLAAVGTVVTALAAYSSVPDQLRDELAAVGVTDPGISHTVWYWVAVVAAVLSVVPAVVAVRWVPDWPEMGTRYDAPGTPAAATSSVEAAPVPPAEQTSLDLWKALDEGHDPTA